MGTPLEAAPALNARMVHACERNGIATLEALGTVAYRDILRWRNIGKKSAAVLYAVGQEARPVTQAAAEISLRDVLTVLVAMQAQLESLVYVQHEALKLLRSLAQSEQLERLVALQQVTVNLLH